MQVDRPRPKVFVAGGTGALGRHAIRALVGDHDVLALARSDQGARWLAGQGARPVQVSIFDKSALTPAIEGCDAVVNLTSAIPPMHKFVLRRAWAENDRVRTEGSATLVDAALEAGVPRFLQESVVMLYRDGGNAWLNEDAPVDDYPMSRPNAAAEANANRFTAEGGIGVVLRLGFFYGPGATHSEQFIRLARHHLPVQIGQADSYVSSIHVADGGRAVAAALHVPAGTYNVVDDQPVTAREYADALAAAARTRPWLRPPGRLALLLGDRLTSLTRSLRVSNERFKKESGWTPTYPSVRQG